MIRESKISRIWKSLMQVWIAGHHGFYVKLLDCLLIVLTRLNRTSVSGGHGNRPVKKLAC